jgi:hypothetical protein
MLFERMMVGEAVAVAVAAMADGEGLLSSFGAFVVLVGMNKTLVVY